MSEFVVECWYDFDDGWIEGEHREEIVRCRDCKHGYKADLSSNWYECMKPDGNGDYARWDVEPSGFCAWGERREA